MPIHKLGFSSLIVPCILLSNVKPAEEFNDMKVKEQGAVIF
jgi:hypothetical protein